MAVHEVGGNSEIPKKPEYKSPDEINLQPLEVYDSKIIGNTLAGIENSVDRDIAAALANDGKVDETEKEGLAKWLNKSQEIAESISRLAGTTFREYYARFEVVIKKLEQYVKTDKAGSVDEPQETDAQDKEYVLTWDLPRQKEAKEVYDGFNSPKGKTEIRYARLSGSINYKIGQLEGFVKAYSDVLNQKQKDYINKEIKQLKTVSDEDFEEAYTSNAADDEVYGHEFGSSFYNKPENGENLRKSIRNARYKEDKEFLKNYGIDI